MIILAETEWPSGLQCHACFVWHGWLWVWAPNLLQCLQTYLHEHGLKSLGYHADPYTVSRCHTRGESEDHRGKKAHKGSTLALKPRVDITRSPKQGYQWPHEENLCSPKIIKNFHWPYVYTTFSKYLGIWVSIGRTDDPAMLFAKFGNVYWPSWSARPNIPILWIKRLVSVYVRISVKISKS